MVDFEKIKKYWYDYPKKVTCKYCADVRYYSHNCFDEGRCPNCDSISFDCRKVEIVNRGDVPADQEIRTAWR